MLYTPNSSGTGEYILPGVRKCTDSLFIPDYDRVLRNSSTSDRLAIDALTRQS